MNKPRHTLVLFLVTLTVASAFAAQPASSADSELAETVIQAAKEVVADSDETTSKQVQITLWVYCRWGYTEVGDEELFVDWDEATGDDIGTTPRRNSNDCENVEEDVLTYRYGFDGADVKTVVYLREADPQWDDLLCTIDVTHAPDGTFVIDNSRYSNADTVHYTDCERWGGLRFTFAYSGPITQRSE